jgi:hypothetical protein
MRDYRFDFANGTTDLVETMSVRTGYVRFYELLSGGGIDPRIRVESMGGGWGVVLRPGQGFRLPAEEAAGVVVTNISGTAMAGALKLGPREWAFEDQRLTGTVNVVDQSSAITQSDQAFAAVLSPNAVAGQYAFGQVYSNTAGKVLEVRRIIATGTAAGTLFVHFDTTLQAGSTPVINRNYGGAALTGRMTQWNNAAAPGSLGSSILTTVVQAGVPVNVEFPEPVRLPQGVGLTAYVNTLGQAVQVNFYGREVSA